MTFFLENPSVRQPGARVVGFARQSSATAQGRRQLRPDDSWRLAPAILPTAVPRRPMQPPNYGLDSFFLGSSDKNHNFAEPCR